MPDFESCTRCECRGHCFDGDLPHTTMGCPECGTCEVCADCDYDGPEHGCENHRPDPEPVVEEDVGRWYVPAGDYPEELQSIRALLDAMHLALAHVEGVLALDLSADEAPAPWERRGLRTRYQRGALDLSAVNLKLALALKARWDQLHAGGGVLPVEAP